MRTETQTNKKTARPVPVSKSTSPTLAPEAGPILWAVDLMTPEPANTTALLQAVALWKSLVPSAVIPAAVVPPPAVPWPVDLSESARAKMSDVVRSSLKAAATKLNVAPAHIETPNTPLLRSSVRALLEIAKDEKASLIAVNTHARRGLRRLGSFTELLIATSTVPVLTVNPKTTVAKKISHLFFPTDFTPASEQLFVDALEWAKTAGAELTIFYQREPIPPVFVGEVPYAINPAVLGAYDDLAQEKRRQGEALAKRAADAGVKAEFVFSKAIGAVGEHIIKTARRRKADLIVMSTNQGRAEQLLLGSIARDVLQGATQPVLIRRPR